MTFSLQIPFRDGAANRSWLHQYLRQLPLSLLCWTGIVLLESSQVFVSDAARGYTLPTAHYVAWATFNWYVFALVSPIIYELGLRYPIVGRDWTLRIFFPHALVCIVCLTTQAFCRGFAGSIYSIHNETNFELRGLPFALTGEWFDRRGLVGAVSYWVIVIIAAFAHLREQVRQRELREAQLESRLASAELEKLRMQIHPHFLFNTLQAAITLVQDDPRAAEDVLLRLSELLRISIDQIESNEIPLARELEFLDLYTGIQQRRFGDRLSVETHSDTDTLNLLVPPLILQPLVENAIRHGIGKHKGSDCVEIFVQKRNEELHIEVWNSNSVVEGATEQLFLRGVGLRNTRARLEQLYGASGQLFFRPLAKGGAGVVITLPARKSEEAQPQPAPEVAG
ncbi:MAG: histidine kinase [Terracidiphilus sp.]